VVAGGALVGRLGQATRPSPELREIARAHSPRAFERVLELVESKDERVALAAARRSWTVLGGKQKQKERLRLSGDLSKCPKFINRHASLAGLRLHDLRHSYASVGAASGVGLPALGRLLGHRSSDTTNRYAHFGDDPLRRASERIAAEITAATGTVGQRAVSLADADVGDN
jgi:hypothetical protein